MRLGGAGTPLPTEKMSERFQPGTRWVNAEPGGWMWHCVGTEWGEGRGSWQLWDDDSLLLQAPFPTSHPGAPWAGATSNTEEHLHVLG